MILENGFQSNMRASSFCTMLLFETFKEASSLPVAMKKSCLVYLSTTATDWFGHIKLFWEIFLIRLCLNSMRLSTNWSCSKTKSRRLLIQDRWNLTSCHSILSWQAIISGGDLDLKAIFLCRSHHVIKSFHIIIHSGTTWKARLMRQQS